MSVHRTALTALAGLTATAALAGCAPGGGGKAIEVVLTGGKNVGMFVSHAHPSPGTLHDAASGLASVSDDGLAIKAKFDRIAASDDRFGEALVTAACYGLTEVAEQDRQSGGNVIPPSAQEWEAYLNNEVARLVPPQYSLDIPGRVSQFNDAAQLASINPRAAYVYVDQCVLGRR